MLGANPSSDYARSAVMGAHMNQYNMNNHPSAVVPIPLHPGSIVSPGVSPNNSIPSMYRLPSNFAQQSSCSYNNNNANNNTNGNARGGGGVAQHHMKNGAASARGGGNMGYNNNTSSSYNNINSSNMQGNNSNNFQRNNNASLSPRGYCWDGESGSSSGISFAASSSSFVASASSASLENKKSSFEKSNSSNSEGSRHTNNMENHKINSSGASSSGSSGHTSHNNTSTNMHYSAGALMHNNHASPTLSATNSTHGGNNHQSSPGVMSRPGCTNSARVVSMLSPRMPVSNGTLGSSATMNYNNESLNHMRFSNLSSSVVEQGGNSNSMLYGNNNGMQYNGNGNMQYNNSNSIMADAEQATNNNNNTYMQNNSNSNGNYLPGSTTTSCYNNNNGSYNNGGMMVDQNNSNSIYNNNAHLFNGNNNNGSRFSPQLFDNKNKKNNHFADTMGNHYNNHVNMNKNEFDGDALMDNHNHMRGPQPAASSPYMGGYNTHDQDQPNNINAVVPVASADRHLKNCRSAEEATSVRRLKSPTPPARGLMQNKLSPPETSLNKSPVLELSLNTSLSPTLDHMNFVSNNPNNNTHISSRKHVPTLSSTPSVPRSGMRDNRVGIGMEDFTLARVIGKGSYGKVMLVQEKATKAWYAMKMLRKDNVIKRNQVQHTKTERNVLELVHHPFIVNLIYAFRTPQKLCFVLEYCPGGELFFHLSKLGRFGTERCCFYAAEILCAIEYLHSLHIIYRDLKPENVLLDADGHVKITDFGLSKEGVSDNHSARSMCGTPEYLAPEILSKRGHGRAVDWYSLGALMFEMLTGLPPFYTRDREKLYDRIRCGDLVYPPHIQNRPTIKSLLQGLLERDPDKRLGGKDDAAEVKRHGFWDGICWHSVLNRKLVPPFVPKLKSTTDVQYFDNEFVQMPARDSEEDGGEGVVDADDEFAGFSYIPSNDFLACQAG